MKRATELRYAESGHFLRNFSPHRQEAAGGPESDDETSWQLRILFAEYDRAVRKQIGQLLRQDGHTVIEVRDGSALLAHVASTILENQRAPFDLIIAEQRLPGVTGLSVLGGLRESDWATPFILLATADDRGLAAEAQRLGGAVLARPFAPQMLRRAVNGERGRPDAWAPFNA